MLTLAPSRVRPPASVLKLSKGVVPPTSALKATSPWLLTVRAKPPFTGPANVSAPAAVLAMVVLAAKVTAPV